MEQSTSQQPDPGSAVKRPVTLPAHLNGDFALGQRTMPKSSERPDYARGQELYAPVVEGPDFARGERTLPATPEGPDYARGLRQVGQ